MGRSLGDGHGFEDSRRTRLWNDATSRLGWTDREADIAVRLIDDDEPTATQIAADLEISVAAVRRYTANLRAKLKAHRRDDLVEKLRLALLSDCDEADDDAPS